MSKKKFFILFEHGCTRKCHEIHKFQCRFSQNANFWSVTGRYVRTIRAIPTKIGTDTLFDMANVVIEPFFFLKKKFPFFFFIVKKKLNFQHFFSKNHNFPKFWSNFAPFHHKIFYTSNTGTSQYW